MIEQARSFDRVAAAYELARPGYPDGVLDHLPVERVATVLDLGAGTGKLTRVLARRYSRVIAVEPLEGMRSTLEAIVPQAESHAGSAEAIPLGDATVDAVFAAQAFHWFSNDEAVGEIARVLRSGGIVAAIWNEPADPSPLPEPYLAYLDTLHAPFLERARSRPPWEQVMAQGPFGGHESAAVAHTQRLDREGVLASAQSMSWIAHRPDAERAEIIRRLDALLPEGPFVFPLRAELHWMVRA